MQNNLENRQQNRMPSLLLAVHEKARLGDHELSGHVISGVQRGCGRCDGPGHPPWGASKGPVFLKNVGK